MKNHKNDLVNPFFMKLNECVKGFHIISNGLAAYSDIWSLAGPRPARLHRMLAYASVQ